MRRYSNLQTLSCQPKPNTTTEQKIQLISKDWHLNNGSEFACMGCGDVLVDMVVKAVHTRTTSAAMLVDCIIA
ncbi:unnamed protein product [Oppiella nova]|uniref:Uncharacterized protein n=1 Tax=Oppiella nova TaxID=334625 RepID=A0A7R9QDJ8_9ACAR|nr:unnamed protein product [Oppiella nova]CAG2162870.1 unnamed protein product [Oppiella nova]